MLQKSVNGCSAFSFREESKPLVHVVHLFLEVLYPQQEQRQRKEDKYNLIEQKPQAVIVFLKKPPTYLIQASSGHLIQVSFVLLKVFIPKVQGIIYIGHAVKKLVIPPSSTANKSWLTFGRRGIVPSLENIGYRPCVSTIKVGGQHWKDDVWKDAKL